MAKIRIKEGTGNFFKVFKICQMSTGFIVDNREEEEKGYITIYTFSDFHQLIMDTITNETDGVIIFWKKLENEADI